MEAAGKVCTHWSKCHRDISAEQNNNNKTQFQSLDVAVLYDRGHLGLHAAHSAASSLFRQTHLDILKSDPQQPGCEPPHSAGTPCETRCLSFSLCLWVSVCLTLVWLGLLSSWSHQSVWGPVKAISILLCESLPAQCLCQQLGTDSNPRRLRSWLWGPLGEGSTSPSFSRWPH